MIFYINGKAPGEIRVLFHYCTEAGNFIKICRFG